MSNLTPLDSESGSLKNNGTTQSFSSTTGLITSDSVQTVPSFQAAPSNNNQNSSFSNVGADPIQEEQEETLLSHQVPSDLPPAPERKKFSWEKFWTKVDDFWVFLKELSEVSFFPSFAIGAYGAALKAAAVVSVIGILGILMPLFIAIGVAVDAIIESVKFIFFAINRNLEKIIGIAARIIAAFFICGAVFTMLLHMLMAGPEFFLMSAFTVPVTFLIGLSALFVWQSIDLIRNVLSWRDAPQGSLERQQYLLRIRANINNLVFISGAIILVSSALLTPYSIAFMASSSAVMGFGIGIAVIAAVVIVHQVWELTQNYSNYKYYRDHGNQQLAREYRFKAIMNGFNIAFAVALIALTVLAIAFPPTGIGLALIGTIVAVAATTNNFAPKIRSWFFTPSDIDLNWAKDPLGPAFVNNVKSTMGLQNGLAHAAVPRNNTVPTSNSDSWFFKRTYHVAHVRTLLQQEQPEQACEYLKNQILAKRNNLNPGNALLPAGKTKDKYEALDKLMDYLERHPDNTLEEYKLFEKETIDHYSKIYQSMTGDDVYGGGTEQLFKAARAYYAYKTEHPNPPAVHNVNSDILWTNPN